MVRKIDVDEAYLETRLAFLNKIKEAVEGDEPVGYVRELAEAYAWVTRPDQAHGS